MRSHEEADDEASSFSEVGVPPFPLFFLLISLPAKSFLPASVFAELCIAGSPASAGCCLAQIIFISFAQQFEAFIWISEQMLQELLQTSMS